MKTLYFSLFAALQLSLAGCGNAPLRVAEQLGDRSYGTVAIVAGPEVSLDSPLSPPAGPIEGAVAGAAAGAVGVIAAALPYCILGPECVVILVPAIAAAPTAAVVGAALGAAESKGAVHSARNSIAKGLAELKPVKRITALAFEMARTQTAFSVRHEDMSDAKELAARGVDTVLEITLTEFRFVRTLHGVAFFVKARARLVRIKDGKVLEEYSTGYGSESRTYLDWGTGGAHALSDALERAWREIAESVMAEHLLVLRTDGKTLRALEPVQQRDISQIFSKIDSPGAYAFVPAGSRRPLLRWEPLDSLLARVPGLVQAAPREVSYELRVYRAVDGNSKVPGRLVYVRDSLLAPEHELEDDLEPCGDYFWTVRAHFILDQRSRTVKFASLWESENDFAESMQHGGTWSFLSRSGYYYRFRAGAKGACNK